MYIVNGNEQESVLRIRVTIIL